MHSIFFVPSAGSARGVVHASFGKQANEHNSNRRLRRQMWCAGALALAACCVSAMLTGCGSIMANAASGSLVASANSLSFGSVPLGQTTSASFSLKNESTAAVQISGVSVTGPFSVIGQNSMPVTIASGGTYAVSLQFEPAAVGAVTGTVTLTSNATSGNTVVSLSGTGTADAPASAPGAMISPASGSVLPGSSVTFTWSAGSGVAEYQLWVGSTGAGSQNLGVFTEGVATGSTVSATASGLPTSGATLYVRLLSEIAGNWQSTDYTYTEASTVSTPVTVSAVSCTSATVTGAGTDGCTVTLSAPAGSGGASVSLASSDSALTVPSSVLVGANRSSATFTAIAAAVSATQTATITASVGTSSATFALQLSPPAATGTAALSLSASSLSFGDVTINTQATPQFVTLLSSGTAALTINSVTVAGAGFTIAGPGFPVTLNPGNAVTVEVKFDPATAGAATGTLTVATNAPTNGTALVSLSGTGDAAAGTLSTLFCQSGTITGAGSDACTVNLTATAPAGGLTVNLSSSDTALTVPATVTVPAGAMGAFFTATATAVTSTQTANVTATAGGLSKIYALQLVAQAPGLSVSSTNLNFGDVTVNTSATETITLTSNGTAPLTVNSATLAGTDFSMSGATFPATLNPGQSVTLRVSFDPGTVGAQTGTITVSSNSASNGTVVIALTGTGESAGGTLSGISCANGTISGAASDSCIVSLSAAAPTGGLTVTLSSNSSSVTVPASVTVAAGARSAGFTATVAAVTSTQSATLTAVAGGVSKVYTLQLNAQTAGMSLSTNSLAFGDVTINTSTSQSVTVTSSGTAPLTLNSATLTGTGFSLGGAAIPVTLNPGQSATLQVTFDPTTAGAETGTILITSNATTNPTATVSLSGTGDTTAGALSSLACTTTSFSAAGTDACTVTLSAAA
ncbi:MAG: choice-of-anchor D domain-containing protein, partial [Acidobacteriaceae bacterium]